MYYALGNFASNVIKDIKKMTFAEAFKYWLGLGSEWMEKDRNYYEIEGLWFYPENE